MASHEPAMRLALLDEALALWDAYWSDVVSSVQTPVDRGVLLRWITEHDRYWRLILEADQSPLVRGSQGQEVANPLYKIADRALAAAERCEKQLGIGGLNKLLEPSLGAVYGKVCILMLDILFLQWRPSGLFAIKGRHADV